MQFIAVISVQFINCTDEIADKVYLFSSDPKKFPAQTGRLSRSAPAARFAHRAIHPMRKARVQVRGRPRTRTQILPLRQLSRSQTPARLYPPAVPQACPQIPGQLPETQGFTGADLRHQSRTSAKKGGTVTGARISRPCRNRCGRRRDDSRQHASESPGREPNSAYRSKGGYR